MSTDARAWGAKKISLVVRAGLIAVNVVASADFTSAYAQCRIGWSKPVTLSVADGRPAYVEAPAAVRASNGRVLLLGTPAFVWAERTAFDPVPLHGPVDTAAYLARLQRNHGFVGFFARSDGQSDPLRPWFVGDGRKFVSTHGLDGTVHVAWLAPRVGGDSEGPDATVWY